MSIRKRAIYVDFQQRAREFAVGDQVFPFNLGADFTGRVVAIFPAIGMVDVQWPHGPERYPVEELQRIVINDTGAVFPDPPNPINDDVPGGAGSQGVPGGPKPSFPSTVEERSLPSKLPDAEASIKKVARRYLISAVKRPLSQSAVIKTIDSFFKGVKDIFAGTPSSFYKDDDRAWLNLSDSQTKDVIGAIVLSFDRKKDAWSVTVQVLGADPVPIPTTKSADIDILFRNAYVFLKKHKDQILEKNIKSKKDLENIAKLLLNDTKRLFPNVSQTFLVEENPPSIIVKFEDRGTVLFTAGAHNYPYGKDIWTPFIDDPKNVFPPFTGKDTSDPYSAITYILKFLQKNKKWLTLRDPQPTKVALYWANKDRHYKAPNSELESGEFTCPKCCIPLKTTRYKREKGKSEQLLACPKCLFLIKHCDIVNHPSYVNDKDPLRKLRVLAKKGA